jgi:NtrC-family two-component system response regulator AlgB
LQSELFGHVRGAFTGAVSDKVGKIAATDGGTLFLDEVGDIPPEIQPQLLRFLQDREYERVGDPKTRTADVRVVAATNKDLAKAVETGDFREDLYYRLRVIPVEIPPLRARREDILDLAILFMTFYSMRHGKHVTGFTDAALRSISEYSWPGNVRELQNAVERAVILSGADRIGATLLPSGGGSALAPLGVTTEDLPTLEGMERRYIEHVLSVADSIERAAEILDIAPSTLWRRRRKFGI